MNFSKKRVTNSGGTRIGCHANHGTGDAIGNAPITKTATIDTTTSISRWDAVLNRDKALDGEFVYAVKTTGVYCRASCASRTAKRINVVFFDTTSDAKVAGFRPCKRCHPDGTSFEHRRNDIVYAACERIRQSAATLSLNELASVSNLSPHHFHRVFKSVTGVTPKEYQKAIQQTRVRDALSKNRTVTEAIYEAGFNSSGRFYASSTAILGMTPQQYQKGGVNEEICYALVSCSMGLMMVAATQRGVCSIEFGDHGDSLTQQLHERFPRAMFLPGDKTFRIWLSRILKYLDQSGHHPGEWQKKLLDLPLDIQGTLFQQQVWKALRDIPAGETLSYSQVAQKIGKPKAIRAVASACASNAIAILIPCHRVVRQSGELSGYRWGVTRKAELLRRESEETKN
jgi:AraC family transcriptional regulator of adaptative response/methylated-DNA-[protein]-cysteine methyltransferase